jgi:phosphatidate phosphatase APP1
MKIYEKPMAIIEKIDVEDVITTSAEVASYASLNDAGKAIIADTDTTIVFEW